MRIYSSLNEETVRARDLLKDWAGEGFVTAEQYERLEKETSSDLRSTNIFLRLVLFLFTVILVGAVAGLAFLMFDSSFWRASDRTMGFFLLIFAVLSYGAAEIAVSEARLYRYGIEEALAVCSVGFLCVGMHLALFGGYNSSQLPVVAAGAALSLWIWHRFGLPYAFLRAMIFTAWLPTELTTSAAAQHVIAAVSYAGALAVLARVRPQARFTYLDREYSIAEALLWMGIYLVINLQLSPLNLRGLWWGSASAAGEFARPFYWMTWVLTWCLPPLVLVRGVRLKDRFVVAAGGLAAVLTLVTNKSYLGGKHHTWDPMLFGAVLIGIALVIRRWLANGPEGIRHGFTARRLSGRDKSWLSVGAVASGALAPTMPAPNPRFQFGGGDSGGGGASSDF